MGFSIDLVEQTIVPAAEQETQQSQVKLEKKESTPQTRIPLLTSNAVDLIAETMTDTQSRRESVDFSLTFFVTGAQFLVRKGSPIKGIQTIAGKRIAAQQGSTNARDHPRACADSQIGRVPGPTGGVSGTGSEASRSLYQRWHSARGTESESAQTGRMGELSVSFSPTSPMAWRCAKTIRIFASLVNFGLMDAIASGKYFEIYEKWFGAKGEVPYPLTQETRRFLQMQVVPK